MVAVNIPTPLRRASGGERIVEVARGGTVAEVLSELCALHEPLRLHLYHGNGSPKRHIFVACNGAQVDHHAVVGDGDVIDLLIATAGG